MIGALLLIGLTTVAAVTDWWWRKIYNATTYTGIVAALVLAGVTTIERWQAPESGSAPSRWSLVELSDSLAGLLACGVVLLLCLVLFRIGGGDVKLLAMIGAFLGLQQGLEAMLWTFVLGGAMAICTLIWKVGAPALLAKAWRQAITFWRRGVAEPLNAQDREELKARLCLGPCALLAVVIVHFELIAYLPDWG